jgi:hypothetical protein
MVNANKRRGTAFESAVRDYFKAWGFPRCERRALTGAADQGDLTGISPHVVIECKDHGTLQLSVWLEEAQQEAINAGADWGAVVIKRRRRAVNEAYVLIGLADFTHILRHLYGEQEGHPDGTY